MPNFRLYDNYQPGAAGGACYLCHAAPRDGEMVVDTGVEISFEGLIWICSVCVSQMAALYGFVEAGAAALAIHEAEVAKAAAEAAEETARHASALADALSGYNEYRLAQDRSHVLIGTKDQPVAVGEPTSGEANAEAVVPAAEEGEGAVGEASADPEPEPEDERPKRGRRRS